MALSKPERAWHYAALATFFSVLGAAFGYLLGYALWEPVVQPFIATMGYEGKMAIAQQWFDEWKRRGQANKGEGLQSLRMK